MVWLTYLRKVSARRCTRLVDSACILGLGAQGERVTDQMEGGVRHNAWEYSSACLPSTPYALPCPALSFPPYLALSMETRSSMNSAGLKWRGQV